jgi:hypothetical protein
MAGFYVKRETKVCLRSRHRNFTLALLSARRQALPFTNRLAEIDITDCDVFAALPKAKRYAAEIEKRQNLSGLSA